jgi:hypothetical protein
MNGYGTGEEVREIASALLAMAKQLDDLGNPK